MRKSFSEGAVLFHEGDPSDCVFQIVSGAVSVIKEFNGEQVVLGRIEAGEFLGEMGVIEDRERSATAIGDGPVEVEVFEKDAFLDLVSNDSKLALNLLRRLSSRLRDMNDHLVSVTEHTEEAATAKSAVEAKVTPGDVVLRGGTFALQFYIGSEPIAITHFPYSIGRYREPGESAILEEPDLLIDDPQPYRLAPVHFILQAESAEITVRDCHTDLGTIVNGKSLGRDFPVEQLALELGENEIIAGGESSPYRFVIIVGP